MSETGKELTEVEGKNILFSREAVCFVLDVSGSMCDSQIRTLKDCYKEFVQRKINAVSQDLIATVVFPNPNSAIIFPNPNSAISRVDMKYDADVVAQLDIPSLRASEALSNLVGSGGTPLADGMNLAAEELDKTDLTLVRMVIMTDGEPDTYRVDSEGLDESFDEATEDLTEDLKDERGAKIDKYVELAANLFINKGIIIDTVAIGKSINEALLKKMAQAAGGVFTNVDSVEDFRKMLVRVEEERKELLGDGIRLLTA